MRITFKQKLKWLSVIIFGWVLGLGEGVTLIGPEDVAASLREEVQRMYEQYR